MYTIKSPIKALGLRLVNTWVLYLGVWTVGGGGGAWGYNQHKKQACSQDYLWGGGGCIPQ